jgi:hypothetical protein
MVGGSAGVILLSLGVYMNVFGVSTGGYSSSRYGSVHHNMLDGYSVMFIGIFMLIYSFSVYMSSKSETYDSENQEVVKDSAQKYIRKSSVKVKKSKKRKSGRK